LVYGYYFIEIFDPFDTVVFSRISISTVELAGEYLKGIIRRADKLVIFLDV
jgi:hypothetical protein